MLPQEDADLAQTRDRRETRMLSDAVCSISQGAAIGIKSVQLDRLA